MDFRYAIFCRADGSSIDMEINHPELGWIPFTASSTDAENAGKELFDAAKASAAAYVPPTDAQRRAQLPLLTARQLRLGLINAGYLLSQVQAAIEALPIGPDRERALVEWDYASSFERMHPLIAGVAGSLKLSDAEIDAIWMAATNL
ncbi:hypothetical protein [Oryzifoliimicrobium ureilyticus]|uniref:hypothetical protein n=1 Tax=Oryzifoliimicrobium ureilyticus TaxID=3113724 RepID=UPI0030765B1C